MPDTRIVITTGEPAGIGPDIIAAINPQAFEAQLVVIGDLGMLRARADALGINTAFVGVGDKPADATAIEVIDHPLSQPCTVGQLDTANADYVLAILRKACLACLAGEFDAMVTAPVQKEIINRAGIPFSGHTEFLAEATATDKVVMMLATTQLRVALATTHLPLSAVPDAITGNMLEKTLSILHNDLHKKFGNLEVLKGIDLLHIHLWYLVNSAIDVVSTSYAFRCICTIELLTCLFEPRKVSWEV